MPDERAAHFGKFLVVACSAMMAGVALLAYEIYLRHPVARGTHEVVIPPGYGSRMIGGVLKKEGVIGSKWAFMLYISVRGEASLLKPGRYQFFETAAIPDIARDLVAGASREKMMVIPEGWTAADIARYVGEQGIGDEAAARDIFTAPRGEHAARFAFLSDAPQAAGLEGYLFPDTYRVYQDAKIEEIAIKMLENFDRKLAPDLRAEIARQKKTIFEIITMASLIEKEVVSDEDRALVSGILWKRLDAGIPLQVDATIVYAKIQLGNGVSKLGNGSNGNGKISIADTKIDSPYNTYRHRGLPLGPIANPGMSAIRAAVYPKSSPYLYYLSAPDGRTIFSKTLDEHNAAKEKYLQ